MKNAEPKAKHPLSSPALLRPLKNLLLSRDNLASQCRKVVQLHARSSQITAVLGLTTCSFSLSRKTPLSHFLHPRSPTASDPKAKLEPFLFHRTPTNAIFRFAQKCEKISLKYPLSSVVRTIPDAVPGGRQVTVVFADLLVTNTAPAHGRFPTIFTGRRCGFLRNKHRVFKNPLQYLIGT